MDLLLKFGVALRTRFEVVARVARGASIAVPLFALEAANLLKREATTGVVTSWERDLMDGRPIGGLW